MTEGLGLETLSLRATTLSAAYRRGAVDPVDVVDEVLRRMAARGADHVWVQTADPARLRAQAQVFPDLAGQGHAVDDLCCHADSATKKAAGVSGL
jgi:hypothetical protein